MGDTGRTSGALGIGSARGFAAIPALELGQTARSLRRTIGVYGACGADPAANGFGFVRVVTTPHQQQHERDRQNEEVFHGRARVTDGRPATNLRDLARCSSAPQALPQRTHGPTRGTGRRWCRDLNRSCHPRQLLEGFELKLCDSGIRLRIPEDHRRCSDDTHHEYRCRFDAIANLAHRVVRCRSARRHLRNWGRRRHSIVDTGLQLQRSLYAGRDDELPSRLHGRGDRLCRCGCFGKCLHSARGICWKCRWQLVRRRSYVHHEHQHEVAMAIRIAPESILRADVRCQARLVGKVHRSA